MTTLKDLSRHLGLSVTQISRALNDHADVSEDTKNRVRDAASELNYQPNLMARRLVTGRSGIVGFVQSRIPIPAESLFFTQFLAGLSANFSKNDRQFVLHMTDESTDTIKVYDKLIRTRSIDGFVVTEPVVDDPRINFLRKKKIPFILHGQTMDQPDYPFYDIDNVAIGYDLTSYLIKKGHTKIAFINGLEGASYVHRREIGYRNALKENGLAYRPDFDIKGDMTSDTGLLETVRLFQSGDTKPTAIIAGNTRIIKGIFLALDALGLSVPRDISVVAHDDELPDLSGSPMSIGITVTSSPLSDSWAPLADYLSRYLDGAELSEVQRIAPHTFHERGSVRHI